MISFTGHPECRVMPATKSQERVDRQGSDLVERFRSGCEVATEQLFQQHSSPLQATVRRLLAWQTTDGTEVEDVVQNVLLAAWKNRQSFQENASLRTWLTRIAINECRRLRRRSWLRKKWTAQFYPDGS